MRGTIVANDDKITLEDIKISPDKIKDLDEKTLNDFFKTETSKESEKDFDIIISLAQELNSRKQKEEIQEDPDILKQLAEKQKKQDQENAKKQQEILDLKNAENPKEKDQKIEKLKNMLEDSEKQKKTLEELIKNFEESEKDNRQENSKLLEDLKDAKRTGNPERIDNFKNIIRNLERKNKELEIKYKKEEIKYPEGEISRMSTKRIRGRFISLKTNKTEEGSESVIKRPSLKRNKNIRSRRKLNQVVKTFNDFQKDSDSAVKYVLTQERYSRAEHILGGAKIDQSINRGRYNLLHKTGFVMSKAKFEEKFDSQKKKILDNFKENINPSKDTPEDTTIRALEKRMDYYKKSYISKHYG